MTLYIPLLVDAMRVSSIIILVAAIGLIFILVVNTVFPQYIEFTKHGADVARTTAGYGVVDENSTFYRFTSTESPCESSIETQNASSSQPAGWFRLIVKIPFNISESSIRTRFSTVFSTGTYGGVDFFWTVNWRLYSNSNVASSDSWSHSLFVSANSPMTLWKNMDASLGEDNSSLCSPGLWYYEATLTVHNATLISSAQTYHNYYSLFLEVLQETAPTAPNVLYVRSLLSALTSGITVAVVLGFYATGWKKTTRQKSHR